MVKCCICGEEIKEHGHNPWPIEGEKCCNRCNEGCVLAARLILMNAKKEDVIKKVLEQLKKVK